MKALALTLTLLFCLPYAEWAAENRGPARDGSATPMPAPVASADVHHVFRVATNVYSGSSPETDAAFAEIAKLGVKTMISVDGAKPTVELAREHGLRYIHLPIGYDGVPSHRQAELIQAALSSPGPLYVHCHHGQHRGPAAVAVICEGTVGWTTNQAVAWLQEAGTAAAYAGLYRSAMEFRPPDAAALARVGALPEVAKTPALVDAMVAIDEEFDRLKAAEKSEWQGRREQPDIVPAHTATILWEHFRELMRADDTARRPVDYQSKLTAAETAADRFSSVLRDEKATAAARASAFQALGRGCADCHQRYRN